MNSKLSIKDQEKFNRYLGWFQGNVQATKLFAMVCFVAELWDDLIDKDKTVSDEDINTAFWFSLIDIPKNRFYQEHFIELNTIMVNGILGFFEANELVKGNDEDVVRSHMARIEICRLANYIACIIGGIEWARKVGADIAREYPETFEEYKREVESHGR